MRPELRPTLVYIYGPPASGKLTVGEKLAELARHPPLPQSSHRQCHQLCLAFGSEPFTEVLHRLRLDVFETAARAGISLIFTNNSAWSGPDARMRFAAFAAAAERAVEAHGGRTVFVRISAPLTVLEERVADDSRRAHRKLLDVGRLRELVSELDQSPLHPGDLSIDTATVSPEVAARTIIEALRWSGSGADDVEIVD